MAVLSTVWNETHAYSLNGIHLIWQYLRDLPNRQIKATTKYTKYMIYTYVELEWVPREENKTADYISRMVDQDDWILKPAVFKVLDTRWGPHTIDRFADMHNHRYPGLIPTWGRRPLIPLLVTGARRTTGGAPHILNSMPHQAC